MPRAAHAPIPSTSCLASPSTAGTETLRSERNTAAINTILSGSTGTPGAGSYHVVTMDGTTAAGNITASTVLDGFSIRNGNADPDGGGLYCNGSGIGHECSPTLNFLQITNNSATGNGAGMYDDAGSGGTSSPTLSNVFIGTSTATGNGGGLFNNGVVSVPGCPWWVQRAPGPVHGTSPLPGSSMALD